MKSYKVNLFCRNVFLGLALFNLEKYDESESCYREAIATETAERQKKDKKENPQPWQGLVNLYEKQGRVNEYMDAALKLATIYRDLYVQYCTSKMMVDVVAKVRFESEMTVRDAKPL